LLLGTGTYFLLHPLSFRFLAELVPIATQLQRIQSERVKVMKKGKKKERDGGLIITVSTKQLRIKNGILY
jgi:hypothetical protein